MKIKRIIACLMLVATLVILFIGVSYQRTPSIIDYYFGPFLLGYVFCDILTWLKNSYKKEKK